MPIQVVSFSTYLTAVDRVTWRHDDYNARNFIHAIKGREIGNWGFVHSGGQWRRFDNANRQEVVRWFGEMVADYLGRGSLEPSALVPVPVSTADLRFDGVQRTATLAHAIAAALPRGLAVRDILRWDYRLSSASSQGGVRDARWLYDRLRLTAGMTAERVILVDDVMTSGGHLRASAARLRAAGAHVVLGVCAGHSDPAQVADPFAVRHDTLDDFNP
jgi:hypothetical protein